MPAAGKVKFSHDDSSSLEDCEKTSFLNTHFVKETRGSRGMLWLTLLNLFIFMLSAMTLVCAVFSQNSIATHQVAALMDDFGLTSPAMHVVEYHETKFALSNPLTSSKYVGITNDVERAWAEVAYVPDQMISMDDFPKLQKPEDAVKVTDPKTGETGYRVGLEVFHQLSCLNMLRVATYQDYHPKLPGSGLNNNIQVERNELDECIEILRMNLMCHADINAFTYRNAPGTSSGVPDYESQHVCRNFDSIKNWAHENAMPAQV
ncbi:hypothetical protein K504DRAFT_478998 [Pleomassaria siparia CBS 279.74]|uniref:Tat pathway signal sequence n=1 Tax=Pleomassaria siparia CBS 279.74 TaxID=1314801 RepID=A0A6G1KJS2_9PLEO|nr:hypothetical protein K504DRAFT_478998 [Pleomassaria siparia CBS 279.74]